MKDIVENRKRIGFATKLRLGALALRENGFQYVGFLALYYVATNLSNFAFGRADALRKRHNLPGANSRAANKVIWETWDWSARGDEWTISDDWKKAVVAKFIDPIFSGRILEIGPGAGRWTEYLVPRSSSLLGIDISAACVDECRKRFAGDPRARFEVGTGSDLRAAGNSEYDGIFSFDVFVHINRPEFEAYAKEIARVLKPGGTGVIHHGSSGGSDGGWRSNMTTKEARELLEASGLKVSDQIDKWRDHNAEFRAGLYNDIITVFAKPA